MVCQGQVFTGYHDDPIYWDASSKGKFSLSLLAVSLKCYHVVI